MGLSPEGATPEHVERCSGGLPRKHYVPAEMIKLYATLFGPSTGANRTVIDNSEVTFYGDKLATIRTSLRHLAGSKFHDRQDAVYGCRKVDGEWVFISHLSVDVT